MCHVYIIFPLTKRFFCLQSLQAAQELRQQEIEDWLPVTGSRKASWYYAAFHNVTAMVGAGVLSLPSAMVYLTW